MTEDEMVGWHHQLNGHEFEQTPGGGEGVGCHFLLQCMKVKSESEVAQSCPTPSDPMDCSLPGSSAHGIFQARVLEWGDKAKNYLGSSFIYTPEEMNSTVCAGPSC